MGYVPPIEHESFMENECQESSIENLFWRSG